jgi:hypothetical protein
VETRLQDAAVRGTERFLMLTSINCYYWFRALTYKSRCRRTTSQQGQILRYARQPDGATDCIKMPKNGNDRFSHRPTENCVRHTEYNVDIKMTVKRCGRADDVRTEHAQCDTGRVVMTNCWGSEYRPSNITHADWTHGCKSWVYDMHFMLSLALPGDITHHEIWWYASICWTNH